MSAGVLLALRGAEEERLVRAIAAVPDLVVTRRCADVEELLAAAIAGLGTIAVMDPECGLDRGALHRLTASGVHAVVLAEEIEQARYRAIGAHVLGPEADVLARLGELARLPAPDLATTSGPGPLASSDTAPAAGPEEQVSDGHAPAPGSPARGGRHPHPDGVDGGSSGLGPQIVTVCGPVGSPGRSTLAVNLAAELAGSGAEVLLVDADIWAGSLRQMLGIVEDSAGLAAAIRAGDQGTLTPASLRRLISQVAPRLQLLPGLGRAHRWREVSSPSLDVLWEVARQVGDWVVIDAPTVVPDDDGAYQGLLGVHRNTVVHSALAGADHVLLVGAAEPIGIERLVQAVLDLDETVTRTRRTIVVNRVRTGAAGPRPQASVREALARFAGVPDVALVPDDRPTADKALLTGVTWAQIAPRSPARQAVLDLAHRLGAEVPAGPGRPRSRLSALLSAR